MPPYARFAGLPGCSTADMVLPRFVHTSAWARVACHDTPNRASANPARAWAAIEDPRVREFADEIIRTQREEIAEMRALIADLVGR
jgi:hypothetical protein